MENMHGVLQALRAAIPAESFIDTIVKMISKPDVKATKGSAMVLKDIISSVGADVIVPHDDINLIRYPNAEIVIIKAGTVLGLYRSFDKYDEKSLNTMVTPYWLHEQECKILAKAQLWKKYRLYNVSLIKPTN